MSRSQRSAWPRLIHPAVNITPHSRRLAALAAVPPWWECWYCAIPLVPVGTAAALALVRTDVDGIIRPIDGYAFPQIDHIVPRVKGGPDEESNLALSCWPCNREKSTRDVDEFIEAKYPELFR